MKFTIGLRVKRIVSKPPSGWSVLHLGRQVGLESYIERVSLGYDWCVFVTLINSVDVQHLRC